MAETDWREILSFSQRELMQADKEKLCESLSWMEADDIELNFSDLKTLFRLAQDILKYKSEQVNNLHGQLETVQRKGGKSRTKGSYAESPSKGSDSIMETIANQEEVIKANKEILEQLYADIAELEEKKSKLEDDRDNVDKDSESSRDVLSEINEVAQLENDITMKNRHIRKLLSDVKVLEEENTKLKEKLSVVKDKLTEATNLIENLTEQLTALNNESLQLKEMLGKSEESKSHLSMEIESLRKELIDKDSNKDSIYNEIKSKAQHWKNVARSKKAEVEALSNENNQLKENLSRTIQPSSPPKSRQRERKIKELQLKLSEASKQIENSADLIEKLKIENQQMKSLIEDTVESAVSETKNECDDNKERSLIIKLKKKVKSLTVALQEAEEMIVVRDKELADITSELQLVQSDEGIKSLLDGLKNKKRQLKLKDEGIKSLVQDVNTLNQLVDELQLENETFRRKLNIPIGEKVPTKGILKKVYETEEKYNKMYKYLKRTEDKLTQAELDNRVLKTKCNKFIDVLSEVGCAKEKIDKIIQESEYYNDTDNDGVNGEGSPQKDSKKDCNCGAEMQEIVDENEGLRKGLQEILNFLKDNSTTSSGILSLECPSLDAILQSMEARHAAGWFAPHMATVMELRAALGGRDALLSALHEARKETFDVMAQLSKETQKSKDLEHQLEEIKSEQQKSERHDTSNETQRVEVPTRITLGEFGSWMSFEEDSKIDFKNKDQIKSYIAQRNASYEDYLKRGLGYFHEKFKTLFEKMKSIVVQTADQQNKWSIQEEHYKAQIENLRAQVSQHEEEDISEDSPGLIPIHHSSSLERKCSYLEESYKYIRTINENMKNEILESKKESMHMTLDYETQIQSLMLIIANLFDKLRSSISIDLFWNQNAALNQSMTNLRKVLEENIQREETLDFFKYLNDQRMDMINFIRKDLQFSENKGDEQKVKSILSGAEQTITKKQLEEMCTELERKEKEIRLLESKNIELQERQAKLIDDNLASSTKEEIDLTKTQLKKLVDENTILKEQCQHIGSQLDIALLQLQDCQQRQMSNDMEINMLRHQILDLQAIGDNKAIIARLSGEVLVAHLQASESHKKIDRLSASLNKEKQARVEAEEMLKARQKVFDIYALRYESKFRYIYEVMHALRQQYHGGLPITSIENYLNKKEDLRRKSRAADEKLQDIEELQISLMTKHSVFEQVLDLSKNKCIEEEDGCPHKLKNMVMYI
ncbi:centrosomal protein of 290 kDa-like [Ostrinia nubilalis]|uniref:centrosomal protein of 290 kDa-like n=1 Tax=Ostrinia nubilalis TaxID=29057 RepID=UPI0030825FFA